MIVIVVFTICGSYPKISDNCILLQFSVGSGNNQFRCYMTVNGEANSDNHLQGVVVPLADNFPDTFGDVFLFFSFLSIMVP